MEADRAREKRRDQIDLLDPNDTRYEGRLRTVKQSSIVSSVIRGCI